MENTTLDQIISQDFISSTIQLPSFDHDIEGSIMEIISDYSVSSEPVKTYREALKWISSPDCMKGESYTHSDILSFILKYL